MASSDAAVPARAGTTNHHDRVGSESETEKHNPTTAHGEGASSPVSNTEPVPEVVPVLGAGGIVGERSEKAEEDAGAFRSGTTELERKEESRSEDSTVDNHDEKGYVSEKDTPVVEKGVVGGEADARRENTDGEEDDEVVYPGKLQLGLLTLGLCLATFTVALGEFLFRISRLDCVQWDSWLVL